MAEIHLFNDIEEARCGHDLTEGHTASDFVEDATCARCLRMHLEGQMISMGVEHQNQIKGLQDQLDLLLRMVVETSLSCATWCGVDLDFDQPLGSDGAYPWETATLLITGNSNKLTSGKRFVLAKDEHTQGYSIKPVGETDVEAETEEKPPVLWDHLL